MNVRLPGAVGDLDVNFDLEDQVHRFPRRTGVLQLTDWGNTLCRTHHGDAGEQSCSGALGNGSPWGSGRTIMNSIDRVAIGSCDELAPGDAVEAFYKNILVYRGPVTEIAPKHGLFWILDTLTGSRRLVDIAEFSVVRLPPHYREVLRTAPGP